jgi:hypothetical protein
MSKWDGRGLHNVNPNDDYYCLPDNKLRIYIMNRFGYSHEDNIQSAIKDIRDEALSIIEDMKEAKGDEKKLFDIYNTWDLSDGDIQFFLKKYKDTTMVKNAKETAVKTAKNAAVRTATKKIITVSNKTLVTALKKAKVPDYILAFLATEEGTAVVALLMGLMQKSIPQLQGEKFDILGDELLTQATQLVTDKLADHIDPFVEMFENAVANL